MPIDFEEARRRRENDPNRVRCAHCGKWIEARAKRCPECGVHFQGEAFMFVHVSDDMAQARANRRRRALVIGAWLMILLIAGTTLYFLR